MKKVFLTAFLAMSMMAFAQHVTPLNITIAELRLDSLRTLYFSEPTMYRASLDVAAQAFDKNEEELKEAKSILKDEQSHAKEMESSLKDAQKMTASLKKIYTQEENTLKSMQKTVEKQQRKLNTNKRLNQDARSSYTQMMERQQKELGYALREVAERLRAVSELNTSIQNWQTTLQTFKQETEQKANALALLESQYKERTSALKAEQKTAKKMQ